MFHFIYYKRQDGSNDLFYWTLPLHLLRSVKYRYGGNCGHSFRLITILVHTVVSIIPGFELSGKSIVRIVNGLTKDIRSNATVNLLVFSFNAIRSREIRKQIGKYGFAIEKLEEKEYFNVFASMNSSSLNHRTFTFLESRFHVREIIRDEWYYSLWDTTEKWRWFIPISNNVLSGNKRRQTSQAFHTPVESVPLKRRMREGRGDEGPSLARENIFLLLWIVILRINLYILRI